MKAIDDAATAKMPFLSFFTRRTTPTLSAGPSPVTLDAERRVQWEARVMIVRDRAAIIVLISGECSSEQGVLL